MIRRVDQALSLQSQRRPEAVAIVDGVSICYEELERRSNQVAKALLSRGARRDDRICLLLPKCVEAVVTLLAIFKAGCIYVPLDPGSPPSRLVRILQMCAPCWLIGCSQTAGIASACLDHLPAAYKPKVCWLNSAPVGSDGHVLPFGDSLDAADGTPPAAAGESDAVAFIIFTSGSTGEPKGVPIRHDGLAQLFSWVVRQFQIGDEDRISFNAPLCFDSSLWDIFCALTSGASLHIVPREAAMLPNLLARFIRDSKVTQWASVPSVLTAIANRDALSYGDFPHLRRLIWYGEAFPIVPLRYWMEKLPHVEFTNFYGPTEVTLVSLYHTLTGVPSPTSSSIPIGRPVPGRRLRVCTPCEGETETGGVGELWIGGTGLSPGYVCDDESTAVKFVEVPRGSGDRWYRTGDLVRVDQDGIFHFHGRIDRQIKLRGYRIELDEVESALNRLPGIVQAAVVATRDSELGGVRICAAYVFAPGQEREPQLLKRELAAFLPSYMLPGRWMALLSLPTNQNGKLDHGVLERNFAERG